MLFETVLSTFLIPRDIIYWVKWIISYVLIRLYKAAHQRRFDLYDPYAVNDPVKLNYLVPDIEKELESPLPESHLQHAVDEVFFYGVNSKSECLLVRISRGHNQEAEAWIYIKLANGKTYQLKQSHGYQKDFGGKCQIFSCGGLQVHYLCPMRRWRIFFCGMLKEISENMESQESTAFVKFAFRWTASSDIHDFSSDMYPFSTASGIAKAEWKYPFIPSVKKLTEALNIYAQSGVINGTISIDEGPDYAMYLFGERLRNIGKMSNIDGCKFKHILGNIPQNGLFLHLAEVSAPHVFKSLPIGFVVEPSADMKAIEDGFIITKLFAVDRSAEDVTANFTAGKKYKLTGKIVGESIVFKSGQGWSGFLDIRLIEFSIKNFKGNGLIMCGEINAKSKKKVQSLVPALLPRDIPLTVCFEDKISQFAEVSGGKGSSLGKLTELSLDDKTFVVPRGIVVTTAAYKRFLTPEILNEIKNVEDVAYGTVEGDLKEACRMIQSMIVRTSLPSEICHSIEENLNIIFNGSINQYKFAVRSSATGEDTEQMSAAGQMDTFLGIMGIKEIFTAVKKCWSSQFGHIAVEYKRQNGQLLNSPMAVVIQEMVASEVSGVLFTCDPVTNNPSVIVMTGNYGLGETVVSGSEEPDTVILCRDDDNNLNVKSVIIGAKNQKMIMKDDGGTVYEKLAESEKIASCISNELAIDLGKLAIKIEKYYRSPRDIEWGISNNTIYIL
ncbi:putative phosphoenolpyruvate synthase, partial [Stegodyphus mimosarum]